MKHGAKSETHPSLPIAVRPNNLEEVQDPKIRQRREQLSKQPYTLYERRESFKRNRERAMRRLMKDAK